MLLPGVTCSIVLRRDIFFSWKIQMEATVVTDYKEGNLSVRVAPDKNDIYGRLGVHYYKH
jgi:hypothetical protein